MPRKWRLAPTRREQDKWDKATKATTGGSVSYMFFHLNLHPIPCLLQRLLFGIYGLF